MITAIRTNFRGDRFRSRLEARWAVFFDRMGYVYEYEPNGYVLDGNPYLPDFAMDGGDMFVEVKPLHFSQWTEDDPQYVRWLAISGLWNAPASVLPPLVTLAGSPADARAILFVDFQAQPVVGHVGACRRCGAFGWHSPEVGHGVLFGGDSSCECERTPDFGIIEDAARYAQEFSFDH